MIADGFGNGHGQGSMLNGSDGGLVVDGCFVMDAGPDVVISEMGNEVVAVWGLDDVAVVVGDVVIGDVWGGDVEVGESVVVLGGDIAPFSVVGVEEWELGAEDGGLEFVGAEVVTNDFVLELAGVSVVTQKLHAFEDRFRGCGTETRFSEGTEVFCEVETEGGCVGERACFLSFVG